MGTRTRAGAGQHPGQYHPLLVAAEKEAHPGGGLCIDVDVGNERYPPDTSDHGDGLARAGMRDVDVEQVGPGTAGERPDQPGGDRRDLDVEGAQTPYTPTPPPDRGGPPRGIR